MTRLPWLILVLTAVGCVSPPSDRSRVDGSVRRTLAERASDPQGVLSYVEAMRGRLSNRHDLAELELAAAEAHEELGRPLSAKLDMSRAWSHVSPSAAGVGGRVQLGWAELEHRTGEKRKARTRWETLLGRPDLSTEDRQQALASLVVASELARDDVAARKWRKTLGSGASRLILTARVRLNPTAAPAPVERIAGGIPRDPRQLLSEIRPRDTWGARPLRSNHDAMAPINAITVHHTAYSRPAPGQGSSAMRSIQRDHQDSEGWADIGYHFVIDPEGGIWEGRPLLAQGAHAGDSQSNRGNIGVCLMGNFEESDVPWAQRTALERLLESLRNHFVLARSDVHPHSRYRSTLCPGRDLQAIVGAYRGA
jgi:hypothetical protein